MTIRTLVFLVTNLLWTFMICNLALGNESLSGGTGFIVDPRGYILTNAHVVERTSLERIEVWLETGEKHTAQVVKTDPHNDLTLLRIKKNGFPSVLLGKAESVKRAEPVWVIGHPKRSTVIVTTTGFVNAVKALEYLRKDDNGILVLDDLIRTDARVDPGSSGSPLVNNKGEVIGIVTMKSMEKKKDRVAFAVPINLAVPLLQNIPDFDLSSLGKATQKLEGPEVDAKVSPAVVRVEIVEKAFENTVLNIKQLQSKILGELGDKGIQQPQGMVLVPQGKFTMGGIMKTNRTLGLRRRTLQWDIALNSYWIDIYEVTNQEYQKCVEAGECNAPQEDTKFRDPKFSRHPVVNVTWHQALTFCSWAGKRLPTEAEWEKAARGTDAREFPWGNAWAVDRANAAGLEDGYEETAPVGSFPKGQSPYGAYDMAGNVWEWVSDWIDWKYMKVKPTENPQGPPEGKVKGIRGGSLGSYMQYLRSGHSNDFNPEWSDGGIGFRCAKSVTHISGE